MRIDRSIAAIAITVIILAACTSIGEPATSVDSTEGVGKDRVPREAAAPDSEGFQPPIFDVEPPVFDGASEDWAMAMVNCLRDEGWLAEIQGTGYWIPTDGEDRMVVAEAAHRCKLRVGVPALPELTPEFLAEIYAHLIETKSCLEAEGYEIDDPPSFEVFMEDYPTGNVWHPYTAVVNMDVSLGEFNRLEKLCPQEPPGLYGQ